MDHFPPCSYKAVSVTRKTKESKEKIRVAKNKVKFCDVYQAGALALFLSLFVSL